VTAGAGVIWGATGSKSCFMDLRPPGLKRRYSNPSVRS
jgi:hypothetical protein